MKILTYSIKKKKQMHQKFLPLFSKVIAIENF